MDVVRIRLADCVLGDEEIEAVARVMRSGVLTNGPRTAEFESVFAVRHQVEHGVAFASGTVALAAIYLGVGIGPGDEVIVPSLTFVSSATSILHVGATPVFCDVDPQTFNLDAQDVARRITPHTKAILAVHYGGQPPDLDALGRVADDAGVMLLEDAAQAHGASWNGRPAGSFGRAAMFSFTPTKNITTGEGGIVTTDDGDLAARLRLLRNHGQTGLHDHIVLGFNWRITEMQAAMGIVQVGRLDDIVARKRANATILGAHLRAIDGVTAPVVDPRAGHVYMLYATLFDRDRDRALAALLANGIEARVYFRPAHRQPIFAGQSAPHLPVTDELASRILCLPFHAKLRPADLAEIASSVEAALAEAVG